MTIPMAQKGWCDHTLQLLYFHEEWLFFSPFFVIREDFLEQSSLPMVVQHDPAITISTTYCEYLPTQLCHETGIKEHLHFIPSIYKCNTPSSISRNYQMPFENTIRIRLRRCFLGENLLTLPRCHPSRRIPSPRLAFVPLDVQGIWNRFCTESTGYGQ